MKHTLVKILSFIILTLTVMSCSGVKNLTKADVDMPPTYNASTVDSLSLADVKWWNFYGDSTLCGLIRKALANNKDILIAAKRVEEARLLYGASKADMLPQLSGTAYANHETNDYSGKKSTRDPEIGLKVTLSWEADLWKRLSWQKNKSEAKYLASIEDLRAMNMTLVAEVAEAYFRLLALDGELEIVKQTLVTRAEGLRLAKLRFEGGLTSELVYRQAEVEYASTYSLVPSLEERIQLTENALLTLTGQYAGTRIPRRQALLSEVVVTEPSLGLPSSLLTRRPDLRSSELNLMAAMADVGITYADRFPRFTIGITGGLENDALANFFKSPFSYVVGSLAGPIFDFGKRKKNYEASIARYDQARLAYEKVVMQAFREVSDAATSFRAARLSAQLKTELLESADKYVNIARIQNLGGGSLYLDVLDAQRKYFDAQISLSNAVRDEYIALVQLYKSLGGGWLNESEEVQTPA